MGSITRPIGEIFKFEDTYLKVIKYGACESCYFKNKICNRTFDYTGDCRMSRRTDNTGIHFEEVKDKTMKKSDLKSGMVIKVVSRSSNRVSYGLIVEGNFPYDNKVASAIILYKNNGFDVITNLTDNMEWSSQYIEAVYKVRRAYPFPNLIELDNLEVIWNRANTELTLKQIAEKFNIPVESLRIKDQ